MAQLPEELVSLICSYLRIIVAPTGYREDRVRLSTLANVSLASKAFSRVARPHVYNTISIWTYEYGAHSRPIVSTLLKRPDTARLVHNLHTQTWQTRAASSLTNGRPIPSSPMLRSQLLAAADKLNLSSSLKQRLQYELTEGLQDAEYAILLCLCTNLQLWEMRTAYRVRDSLVLAVACEAVANIALGGSPPLLEPLQHLRELRIEHGDTEGCTSLGDFTELLSLPKMETLRGHMLACDKDSFPPTSLRSRLKRIHLGWSLVDGPGLERLLTACPVLETIAVEWGDANVGESWIEYDQIGQALRGHGTKLKSVKLRPEEANVLDQDPATLQPLGNLRELTSLQLLAVPFSALFGGSEVSSERSPGWLRDILPVSLKTLRITESDDDGEEQLDAQLLRVMIDEQFEQLSTIRVDRGDAFSENAQEVGWDDSESNKFWVVLKRARESDNAAQT